MALEPVDGGTGNINGDFQVTNQQPSIISYPDGRVVDAVTVSAYEKAFNVPFGFTVPTSTWEGALFETYARVIASYIQEIGQAPHVVGIYSAPDTDISGFLHDYLFVTVGLDNSDSTATVRVLQDQSNSVATFAKIDAAYQVLLRNESL